jgi:sulfatase modifying factor 1
MRKLIILYLILSPILSISCKEKVIKNLIFLEGGAFKNTNSSYFEKEIVVSNFYIGKYEVSQKEWAEIMGSNPSKFNGNNLPVENVNWYDCIEYCNKRSVKEGLKQYYNINKNIKDPNNNNDLDTQKWTVTINKKANGYRLPTIIEWEYASGGGQKNINNYIYSGSNELEKVGWFWINSGNKELKNREWNWDLIQNNNCKTKPIGIKIPNELGLYDMSGNVKEWCWEWNNINLEVNGRGWRGGGWAGGDFCCESSFLRYYTPDIKSSDQGLRICRSNID